MQKAVSGFSLTGILDNNGLVQNVCHKMFATNSISQMSATLPAVLSYHKNSWKHRTRQITKLLIAPELIYLAG